MSTETTGAYPVNRHADYHAHLYFDADTLAHVQVLCERISREFGLKVGRIHQKPVGPHTRWSVQVMFTAADFDCFIPWLEAQRGPLDVLVHGVTGDEYRDHTDHAYWLGTPAALDLSIFTAPPG
ncbi:DOPA 4,5-dioxygenase family protein [Marinobacterium weihaiense]|uniref:DOPA 4,5-dioxygenase family protein n=1 Tax=Marinobacterium weihaiense TaxID=2851016 RepID=A0ABS6M8K9_9GAMM|nr:DOPA 4,5-dioxygenase family protein [Marinobacterium weihaiense]MBV0932117.1 DOPA 4,5-dioxygenase family protein [Marinobacterium weihaiense]